MPRKTAVDKAEEFIDDVCAIQDSDSLSIADAAEKYYEDAVNGDSKSYRELVIANIESASAIYSRRADKNGEREIRELLQRQNVEFTEDNPNKWKTGDIMAYLSQAYVIDQHRIQSQRVP